VTESDVLEVSVLIAASPETVFAYFTDPERYVEWMGSAATLDPVPGGVYRVHMRDGVQAVGRFLEVDPPHRLVFSWGWDGAFAVPPGSTRVVVTFTPEDGGTRVRLRHHGLPDEQERGQHGGGWELYLGRLAVRAAGGDPGADPNA
jgi:uncharacterized protein YndB with AHSA1/START domain